MAPQHQSCVSPSCRRSLALSQNAILGYPTLTFTVLGFPVIALPGAQDVSSKFPALYSDFFLYAYILIGYTFFKLLPDIPALSVTVSYGITVV